MDILLRKVRFSYLTVYTPRAMEGTTNERYSTVILFPKDSKNLEEVRGAMDSVARDQWSTKSDGILKQLESTGKTCLKDGDTRLGPDGEVVDGFEGCWYISASTTPKQPPRVFNRFGEIVDEEKRKELGDSDRRGPRSGDYGDVRIRIWAQDNDYGKRINAQLLDVAFRQEGPPLGRREKSDDEVRDMFGGFEEWTMDNMHDE